MIKNYLVANIVVIIICLSANPLLAKSATKKIQEALSNSPDSRELLIKQNSQLALIAKEALPAIVNISSRRKVKYDYVSPYNYFFDHPFFNNPNFKNRRQAFPKMERVEKSLGSGFIISENGHILTNHHVVQNADEVVVIFADGREYEAEILGTDQKTDVAVLKIKEKNLPYLEFADSDKSQIGEIVIALGNPFSVGITVTQGIISAKGRNKVGITTYENFIQTDAAINPGNSGGPLLNIFGEVVGMNTAILSKSGGSQGIGFAIPINMVNKIKESILNYGQVERAYLGVYLQDMSPSLAHAFGLKKDQKGALVAQVFEDSPADISGLKSGDIILTFNRKTIHTSANLRNIVGLTDIHKKNKVTLIRDGEIIELIVELRSKKETHNPDEQKIIKKKIDKSVVISEITPEYRQKDTIPNTIKGVVITGLDIKSKAAQAGLKINDIVQTINNKPINSIADYNHLISVIKPPLAALIYRDGLNYYIIINE